MIKTPIGKMNAFIELKRKEGKEVIHIARGKQRGLGDIIRPIMCLDQEENVFGELMDVRNMLPIGGSILLKEGVRNINSINKYAVLSIEPDFNIGLCKRVGSRHIGRYGYSIDREFQSFVLRALWASSDLDGPYYPLRTLEPSIRHIHSLMNSIVMRDTLITNICTLNNDESTKSYKAEMELMVRAIDRNINKLIDSYPVVSPELWRQGCKYGRD